MKSIGAKFNGQELRVTGQSFSLEYLLHDVPVVEMLIT